MGLQLQVRFRTTHIGISSNTPEDSLDLHQKNLRNWSQACLAILYHSADRDSLSLEPQDTKCPLNGLDAFPLSMTLLRANLAPRRLSRLGPAGCTLSQSSQNAAGWEETQPRIIGFWKAASAKPLTTDRNQRGKGSKPDGWSEAQ